MIAKSAGSSPARAASPSVAAVVPMLVNEIDCAARAFADLHLQGTLQGLGVLVEGDDVQRALP